MAQVAGMACLHSAGVQTLLGLTELWGQSVQQKWFNGQEVFRKVEAF